MKKEEDKIMDILTATDVIGQKLFIGDLVLRSCFSNITFHRIVKINKRSVSISSGARVHFFPSGRTWSSRAYAQRIEEVDLSDFNNNSPIKIWKNYSTGAAFSLYKISQ